MALKFSLQWRQPSGDSRGDMEQGVFVDISMGIFGKMGEGTEQHNGLDHHLTPKISLIQGGPLFLTLYHSLKV